MNSQQIRNLVGQVIKEHISYQVTKDLESIHGNVDALDEENTTIAQGAMSSSSIFECDDTDSYGEFRGERVKLNTPYKGSERKYVAYLQKEGKVVKVHFDAQGK